MAEERQLKLTQFLINWSSQYDHNWLLWRLL